MRFDINSQSETQDEKGGKKKSFWPLPPIANLLILLVLMVTVISISINTKTPSVSEEKPASSVGESSVGENTPEPTVEPAGTEPTKAPAATPAPTESPTPKDVAVVEREPKSTTKPTAAPTKKVEGLATESLGGVLVVDDSAYEFYNFNQEVATSYIDVINTAATSLKTAAGATLCICRRAG